MMTPEQIQQSISRLFQQMDDAYANAANPSGFQCNGCRDNCCLTKFYHHTLLEVLYIRSGLRSMPADRLTHIRVAAQAAIRQMTELHQRDVPVRVMCPLNDGDRCILYDRRPMICRLHGIPHALRRPDGQMTGGPGCDDYDRQCPGANHEPLDRTPLYRAMADLERRLRAQLEFNQKIKMTVAEIIVADEFDDVAARIEEHDETN